MFNRFFAEGALRKTATILLLAKAVLLFIFAFRLQFVMDEFWQLGQAKYLFNDLFHTKWPAKAVGYAVFYLPAHELGNSAVSVLTLGRLQAALLGCGTCVLTYLIAIRLGEDRLRALIIVLLLLCFSNMMERLFRTRAEPVALFFGAFALYVMVGAKVDQAGRLFVAGVLSGLSFLSTQKAIYFNFGLGAALFLEGALSGRYRNAVARGALLVSGWAFAVAVYCLIFGGSNPERILENIFFGPVEVAVNGGIPYSNLRIYLYQTLIRNFFLYIACFVGIATTFLGWRNLTEQQRIALIFTSIVSLLVAVHNQPWPYVFIMAQPFLVLWVLRFLDVFPKGDRNRKTFIAMIGFQIVGSFASNILTLNESNATQLAVVKKADRLLRTGEEYFDGTGMLPNRRESTSLWLDARNVMKTLDQKSASEAAVGLKENPPKLIIWSYRMLNIEPVVGDWIERHYVKVDPNLWVTGSNIAPGKASPVQIVWAGEYRVYGKGGEPLPGTLSNGTLTGPILKLEAGEHEIDWSGPDGVLLPSNADYVGMQSDAQDIVMFPDLYRKGWFYYLRRQ